MQRKRPPHWDETDYLVLMEVLQRFAEQNVDGSPDIWDLPQVAKDPHSRRALQMRDGIAAYLGIKPWEWENQLYGR